MWHEVISLANFFLVFGPLLVGTRRYNLCFRDRANAYSTQIYKNIAKETLGEVQSSSALTMAYQEKVIQLCTNEIHFLRTAPYNDFICFNKTEHDERFFRVFDNMCQQRMLQAICGFNDYKQPIVDLATVDDYVNTAPLVFPKS